MIVYDYELKCNNSNKSYMLCKTSLNKNYKINIIYFFI